MVNQKDKQEDFNAADHRNLYGCMNDYVEAQGGTLHAQKKPGEQKDMQKTFYDLNMDETIEDLQNDMALRKGPDSPVQIGRKTQIMKKDDWNRTFSKWIKLINQNYNLCLFGLGSKREILETFVDDNFADFIQLRVKGYATNVYFHNVLIKLIQALEIFADDSIKPDCVRILNSKKPKQSETYKVMVDLLNRLKFFGEKIVILLHNIDGKNFREFETHEFLSKIAKHPACIFIASFDNVLFPQMFSRNLLEDYKFTFVNINTYKLYEQELFYLDLSLFNKQEKKSSESLKMVYIS